VTANSRFVIAIILACVSFVGIAAVLKTSEQPSLAPSQPSIEASMPMSGRSAPAPVAIDRAFFSKIAAKAASSLLPLVSAPASAVPLYVPGVTAEAYLVGDVATGKVYLEKNAGTILPVASMSKLITAIAATDSLTSTTTITITPAEADVPPDGSALRAGETFTMPELLLPLLLDSSNVAAEALASTTNRRAFTELMSSYAWEVGMPGSFFADPSGLSERNVATAKDFFALAKYLYHYRPDILALTRIVSTSTATTTLHGSHDFVNIHPFVTDPRFIGGKTGHTPIALDTMLTIMNLSSHPIAIIVLRSQNARANDTNLLINEISMSLAAAGADSLKPTNL
jgi:D-alanyl-D-alanine endopeptidase (penicillin-binding protein 7)